MFYYKQNAKNPSEDKKNISLILFYVFLYRIKVCIQLIIKKIVLFHSPSPKVIFLLSCNDFLPCVLVPK
jgi:hypothetical protein